MSLYYGTAYGYDMLEMAASPCISASTTFGGDITFPINQPGNNAYIVGKQSYISAQLKREDGSYHPLELIINSGTRAAPTAVSVPYRIYAMRLLVHFFKIWHAMLRVNK